MKYIVDRFEGETAVLEESPGKTFLLDRRLIPGAGEGSVIEIRVLEEETKQRKEEIQRLADSLFVD